MSTSSSISTRSVVTIGALTVVGGLVAYAAYFDYKRRNDPTFRKRLRKEKKRAQRANPTTPDSGHSNEELKAALKIVRDEPLPSTVDEREQYFMENVQRGEALCTQGPMFEMPAALSFYRALRVYPSPVELIMIYQKTVPEPVFKLVMQMTSLDVKERAEGYYDKYPASSYNVKVTQIPVIEANNQTVLKSVLVADKDFKAGEIIYKEKPIAANLDIDLEGKAAYCSYCFRAIEEGVEAVRPENDPLGSAYCSKECELLAFTHGHNLLFGSEPFQMAPGAPMPPVTPARVEARKIAQAKFAEFEREHPNPGALLVARYVGRLLHEEMAKVAPGGTFADDEYTLNDHVERLRFLEFNEEKWKDECGLLKKVLSGAAEGLEEFARDERYSVFVGKMAYNAIGVSYEEGRQDKPESPLRPEDCQLTRTPNGTNHQIGSGLYLVSSYMAHSCAPSVKPTFSGTNELHVVAAQDIKKGDQLTMAYVDVNRKADEDVTTSRRNRRQEIARGWRFACECTRCVAEAPVPTPAPAAVPTSEAVETAVEEKANAEEDVKIEGPAAKVEEMVARYESGEIGPEFREGLPPKDDPNGVE